MAEGTGPPGTDDDADGTGPLGTDGTGVAGGRSPPEQEGVAEGTGPPGTDDDADGVAEGTGPPGTDDDADDTGPPGTEGVAEGTGPVGTEGVAEGTGAGAEPPPLAEAACATPIPIPEAARIPSPTLTPMVLGFRFTLFAMSTVPSSGRSALPHPPQLRGPDFG